jgi:hypothetical protein
MDHQVEVGLDAEVSDEDDCSNEPSSDIENFENDSTDSDLD